MQQWNSEHYPDLGVFYSIGHPVAFDKWAAASSFTRPEPKLRSLDEVVSDFRSSFEDGEKKFWKETIDGVVRLITEPHVVFLETVEFVIEAIKNPAILMQILYELADSFETMVINGDAQSRGKWFGYAVPTVGSIFLGGSGIVKGAGKAAQVGRKTQTDLEIKLKDKQETPKPISHTPPKKNTERVRELMTNLVPRRGMEPALVMINNVPFNVFNGMNIVAKMKQIQTLVLMRVEAIGFGRGVKGTTPDAFRQTEFASSYEARLNQTPSPNNSKVGFEGVRGESLSTLKPPPDPELKQILDEAGIKGIQF